MSNGEARRGAETEDGHTHESLCLNCNAALAGPYCHDCGQRGHVHRTIGAFFHDLAHGVLHFEGKTWHTLPLLVWRPGELTRRYVEGQRARFVSPIALFLFSVFLMFAIVSATGSIEAPRTTDARQQMRENLVKDEARLRTARAERLEAIAAHRPTNAIDQRIAVIAGDIAMERAMADKGIIAGAATRVSDDVPPFLRKPIQKARDNPELVFYKLRTNAYKFSWALIPLSVPFLWLLFPFSRRYRMYDHTVFVTYSLCFMTLLVCIGSLLSAVGASALAGFALFVVPIHMFRQLRGAYALSAVGALWRTVLLVLIATVVLSLFAAALFALGLFE